MASQLLVHNVFFALKDKSPSAIQTLIAACHKYLTNHPGTLYFGAQDDAAYAIGADGAVQWRFETGADVDAPLTMLSDGSLVVASEDGTIAMLLP